MTIFDLQESLAEEVGRILKDVETANAAGEKVSGVTVHRQQLPIIVSDEEDASQFFPYAIVRLIEGACADDDSPWGVTADVILGVHDEDPRNQGHAHVMVMCQRLVDRFAAEPLLDGKYWAHPNIEWAVQDADAYPYFFGGVRLQFSVPKIGRSMTAYD